MHGPAGPASPAPQGQTSLECRGPRCVSAGKPTAAANSQTGCQRRSCDCPSGAQTRPSMAGLAQRSGDQLAGKGTRAPAPRDLRETEGRGQFSGSDNSDAENKQNRQQPEAAPYIKCSPLSHSPRAHRSHMKS